MELSHYYKSTKYTKAQNAEMVKSAKIRTKILSSYLKKINPKKVLELGCGEGSLGYEIKKIVGNDYYGLDLSDAGVRLSKEKGIIAKKADLNLGIQFGTSEFDLVFSNQVLEHINNTDLLLKESFRVLKKGGYFIAITPNLSFWVNRLLFPLGVYPVFLEASTKNKLVGAGFLKKFVFDKETVGHIRVFNLPALIDMVEYHGFTVEKEVGIPFPFKVPNFISPFYNILDWIFSRRPSLARDIMIIAKK